MNLVTRNIASEDGMIILTLVSGRDFFPRKIKYKNGDGEIKYYYLVETKRGRLRLESCCNRN